MAFRLKLQHQLCLQPTSIPCLDLLLYLSVHPSISLSVCPPIYHSIYLPLYLSIYLSICLSIESIYFISVCCTWHVIFYYFFLSGERTPTPGVLQWQTPLKFDLNLISSFTLSCFCCPALSSLLTSPFFVLSICAKCHAGYHWETGRQHRYTLSCPYIWTEWQMLSDQSPTDLERSDVMCHWLWHTSVIYTVIWGLKS